MTTRITVHIAHAAFLPERAATLDRLMSQLAGQRGQFVVHRSEQREHASVWATRVWAAAAAEDAEAAIILNDDVEVSPDLVAACRAMLAVKTSRMVSLHAVHPMARSLAEAGLRAFSTYHLTGPAYMLRKGAAAELLAYFESAPKSWTSKVNEDNWAIQYAFRIREPIWNCIPALAKHDESIPSSLGYDHHPGRVTQVDWRDPIFEGIDMLDWQPLYPVPFIETHWTSKGALTTTEIAVTLGISPETCWFCLEQPAICGSDKSGTRMCGRCLHLFTGNMINTAMRAGMR